MFESVKEDKLIQMSAITHLCLSAAGPELSVSTCQTAPQRYKEEPVSTAPPFAAGSTEDSPGSQTLSLTVSAPAPDLTSLVRFVPSASTVLLVDGAPSSPPEPTLHDPLSPDSSSVSGLDPVQDKVFCRLEFVWNQ